MSTLLAKVRRQLKDGTIQEAVVNPESVRYVFLDPSGKPYISFQDHYNSEQDEVTPIGLQSPDSMTTVLKGLNRPYIIDASIRFASLIVAALAVAVAIWFSSGTDAP